MSNMPLPVARGLKTTDNRGLSTSISTISDSVPIENSSGTVIDPATEGTLSAIAAALASNATDHLLVQENTALDVSAATVTITDNGALTLDATNQGTLPTEQQTPVGIEDSTGTQVDPLAAGDQPLDVSAATVTITDNGALTLDAANQGTLPVEQQTAVDVAASAASGLAVEQQTPVGVEDTTGTQVDPRNVTDRSGRNLGKARLMDSSGVLIEPRTDAFGHHQATNVDVNSATETVSVSVPDRADTLTVHVETSGAAHVEVRFQDGSGNTVTQRDDTENGSYGVSGAGDIFVDTEIASPNVEVAIVDDSGASNSCDYNIYAR